MVNNQYLLSKVTQNYLKAIWNFNENGKTKVSSSMLANRISVANSTASETIKKLGENKLIKLTPYYGVELTDLGEKLAIQMVRKHRIIEAYLYNFLEYKLTEIHEEAEILEHEVSNKLINKMYKKLNYIKFDPHGDPIPDIEGNFPRNSGKNLSNFKENSLLKIVKISDKSPEVLKFFEDNNFLPNVKFKLKKIDRLNNVFILSLDKKDHIIGKEISSNFWVSQV